MSTTPPTISGLHHLKIPVSSLEASLNFYTNVLQGKDIPELTHKDTHGTVYAHIISIGSIIVELRHDPSRAAAFCGANIITLAASSANAWSEWFGKCGANHSGVLKALKGEICVVEDPDGMRVRIYEESLKELRDPKDVSVDSNWLA